MRQKSSSQVILLTSHLRALLLRSSYVLLVGLSFGLLLLNPTEVSERWRMKILDVVSPILQAVQQPAASLDKMAEGLRNYQSVLAENEMLRTQNESLLQWQQQALQLTDQNQQLQKLLALHLPAAPQQRFAARLLTSQFSPYAHSVVLAAGTQDGVREGMPVMGGQGLLGRVAATGQFAARIVLLTDPASRLPVRLQRSSDKAILSGDGSAMPSLRFLPQESDIKAGDVIVTAALDGFLPADLPVGVVVGGNSSSGAGEWRVRLYDEAAKQDIVQLLNYHQVFDLPENIPNKSAGSRP